MKFLKYSIIILVVAVVTNYTLASAYASPSTVAIIVDLEKNEEQWTEYKTKTTWSTQTYEHISSITWLSNPCNDCLVRTISCQENGDCSGAVTTIAGQTRRIDNPTSINVPHNYRLNLKRDNWSALTTHHNARWNINQ